MNIEVVFKLFNILIYNGDLIRTIRFVENNITYFINRCLPPL